MLKLFSICNRFELNKNLKALCVTISGSLNENIQEFFVFILKERE